MADPLSFEALASSEHVLSSAENFVLYVLLEAVARGPAAPVVVAACRSTLAW